MKKRAVLGIAAVALLAISVVTGFSQVPQGQNRVPQEVVINGQTVTAATVTTSTGQIQSFTCSSPQRYITPNGASQGWACYESTTGVWLLNAIPPTQAQSAPAPSPAPLPAPVPQQAPPPAVQQPPVTVYPQTAPPVIYQAPVVYPPVIYSYPVYAYPAPAVVYAAPYRPVYVAPAYSPGVFLGAAAINAAGRIASAAIISSHYPRVYYPVRVRGRIW